jgi:hypothetical protein
MSVVAQVQAEVEGWDDPRLVALLQATSMSVGSLKGSLKKLAEARAISYVQVGGVLAAHALTSGVLLCNIPAREIHPTVEYGMLRLTGVRCPSGNREHAYGRCLAWHEKLCKAAGTPNG